MKYTITINQAGIVDSGYADKTDITDWAIIEYICAWQRNTKAIKRGEFVWINYRHLAENMPLLGLNSKQAVSKRIIKLADLYLLEIQHGTDGRVYVRPSASCHATVDFREKKDEQSTTVDDSQPPLTQPSTTVDATVNHGGHPFLYQGSEDQGKNLEACVPPTHKKRATRLPADWAPTPDQIAWARSERKDINPATEASKFRDYWIAKAGRDASKLDWDATWRNWVRNAKAVQKVTANSSEPEWLKGAR